ncbi:MAG: hypothetical protein ACKPH7_28145 [Planktothrix sp.]|uniref:hypothetical protein n=1 Tax=Planktothrix sp. TaxID=3088171 RepID=UPI0038D45A99
MSLPQPGNIINTLVSAIFPDRIEDNTSTITAAKLWIAFGVGIWLIVVATSLALGYGPGTEVWGIPTQVVWLCSGLLLIILGITRIGLKGS